MRLTSPSAGVPPLQRSYKDVDLVGRASQIRDLKKLFAFLGYVPRETFNMLQGGRRMIFNDMVSMRRVDVFLDYFEMCHKFDLRRLLRVGLSVIIPSLVFLAPLGGIRERFGTKVAPGLSISRCFRIAPLAIRSVYDLPTRLSRMYYGIVSIRS